MMGSFFDKKEGENKQRGKEIIFCSPEAKRKQTLKFHLKVFLMLFNQGLRKLSVNFWNFKNKKLFSGFLMNLHQGCEI